MREEQDFAAGSILGDRSTQEDSFGFLLRKRKSSARANKPGGSVELLAALADGMGGHHCGEIASRAACDRFLRVIEKSPAIDTALVSAAEVANAEIRKLAARNPKCAGMGCTLVAAYLSGAGLRWLSVGDSHLYLWRDSALTKLNDDHSLAPVLRELVKKGELTEEEARTHPDRNALRSALSGGKLSLIDCPVAPVALKGTDIVMLASDGIDEVNDEELSSIIGDQRHRPARRIVDAVLDRVGRINAVGQDNATVMIINLSATDLLKGFHGPL